MPKILVVEDELHIREAISELLSFNDFSITTVDNGNKALDILLKEHFDLVICDIMMPHMDGYELLITLRQERKLFVPFIYLTAKVQYDDYRAGMNLGADDYIHKPFKSKDLIVAIHKRLADRAEIINKFTKKLDEIENVISIITTHEIRTPMNGILNFSQILRERAKELDDVSMIEICDHLTRSSIRLFNALDKVRLFCDLKAGRVQSRSNIDQLVDCNNLVKKIANDLAIRYQRMEDLSFSNSQSEVFEIDQELFAIVVNEIMDNSFKFTSTGEKIQVSSCLSDNTYTLIINDFGHRLKAESIGLNDFLMQYNRGHYEQQGLGLGLAIVRMIVQIIKGEISFTNNTPSGISVTISIPINE